MLATIGGGVGGGTRGLGPRNDVLTTCKSGHPAADNYSIFPTVNIIRSKKRTGRGKSEMLKKLKTKSYHTSLFFLHIVFVYRY